MFKKMGIGTYRNKRALKTKDMTEGKQKKSFINLVEPLDASNCMCSMDKNNN